LLRILRETALVSGQSTEAAGLPASSFNIRPLTSKRFWEKTGVETACPAGVFIFCRQ
jgi:hypothetical protein